MTGRNPALAPALAWLGGAGRWACGGYQVAVQQGWILGIRCGNENILAAARDLAEAERSAARRENELVGHASVPAGCHNRPSRHERADRNPDFFEVNGSRVRFKAPEADIRVVVQMRASDRRLRRRSSPAFPSYWLSSGAWLSKRGSLAHWRCGGRSDHTGSISP
jgi:hypothetical protein